MRFISSVACVTCVVVLAATSAAHAADEESTPDYASNTAIGDLGGQRAALFKQGLSVEAGYKLDHLRNLAGGIGRGSASMGNLDLKLRADLDRLMGLPGATAYLHVLDNRGAGINARHIGSLMGVTNVEVPVPTTRVFHAWVQQTFMAEQWSLLAGLYPIDSEFSVMESAGVLLHPAYGPPADLSLTRGPSIFNNSSFGLRLKWQSPDRTLYAMGALLDGIPGNPNQPKGTHIRFNKGDGSFAIAEIGWTPIEFGHVFEPIGPTRMLQTPELRAHEKYEGHGKYAAGLWRYSSKVDDQLQTDGAGNPLKRPSWGGYLFGERSLFGIGDEPGRYLTGFARYAFTDGDSTPIRSQLNLGVSLRGPFAGRTDDFLALGWTQARLAAKFRAAQWRDNGISATRNETAVELTYRAALTPWLSVQPNLQWIRHPGGDAAVRNARLVGLRLEIML